MAGRFAGWLIYFPPLPNWVSMFQNSTGGSSTTFFTLQDWTFPVAWFSICRKCPSCLIWTNLYLGLHLRSHLLGCLFLKYTLSLILKEGGVLSIVFCAVLKQFSSNVFLAMANASLCFKIQHSRIWISQDLLHGFYSWCRGKFGSLPYTKKNGIFFVARLGVTM